MKLITKSTIKEFINELQIYLEDQDPNILEDNLVLREILYLLSKTISVEYRGRLGFNKFLEKICSLVEN